jgi:hypothetical protein
MADFRHYRRADATRRNQPAADLRREIEEEMKVRLKIEKGGVVLHEQSCDVSDAESFGKAFAHAWTKLHEQQLERATSVGALFEHLNDRLLDELNGASFSLTKI